MRYPLLVLAGTLIALGCGSDTDEPTDNADCATSVASITSPASGAATLHGSFYSNESVLIQESDGTVIAQGTPDSNRDAFTLTGVPSGDHRYRIVISCDDGRDDLGTYDFNIQ